MHIAEFLASLLPKGYRAFESEPSLEQSGLMDHIHPRADVSVGVLVLCRHYQRRNSCVIKHLYKPRDSGTYVWLMNGAGLKASILLCILDPAWRVRNQAGGGGSRGPFAGRLEHDHRGSLGLIFAVRKALAAAVSFWRAKRGRPSVANQATARVRTGPTLGAAPRMEIPTAAPNGDGQHHGRRLREIAAVETEQPI